MVNFLNVLKYHLFSQINLLVEIVTFIGINMNKMEGINYLTDDKNRKVAVQIDLKKYGDLWEDFYDSLMAELRKDEEKIPLKDVINDLKSQGKLDESI